jgi:hypothetical protein
MFMSTTTVFHTIFGLFHLLGLCFTIYQKRGMVCLLGKCMGCSTSRRELEQGNYKTSGQRQEERQRGSKGRIKA